MQGGQGDSAHPSSPPLSSLPPPPSSSLSSSPTWPTTKGDGAPASSSSNGSRPSTHGREQPSVPLVSGSGARVPTQLLDQHGAFSRQHHQASNGPLLESGPRSSGASGSNDGGVSEESNAIDLTNDDQDEFQVVSSKGPDVQRQLNQSAFVDAPVCIGMINSVVLSVFGLPQALVAYPSATSDPKWSPSEWPPNCEYYIEGGYRPIHLAVKPATEPQAKLDVDVFEVISPLESREHAAVHGQPPPNGLKLRPTAFGTLAEKYSRALAPLMLQRLVGIKARCRLVAPNAAQNFLHALELLIFTTRRHLNAVSNILYSENVILETPAQYDASQHAGAPEFFNPHGSFGRSNQAASGGQQTPQPFSFGSRATLMQTKEATEQERKKQVDTVYAALRGGEDLESVEAPKLVTTPLLPHQKQALAFLLDRERFRRFEDAIGKGKGKSDDPVDVTKDDSGIVSLWMPAVRFSKSSGNNVTPKITSFVNVVTRSEQGKRPRICRGAILADDMGLGKTIVTIALIAATLEEARRFGASKPGEEEEDGDDGAEKEVEGQRSASGLGEENGEVIHVADDSDEDVTVEDFNINVHGAPPPRKKPRKARKPKVSKKAKKKEDAESLRLAQIAIRSRATLLVLPLTLVSNWEGQIKEHWDASKQPSIYLYHGSTRITDPHELAQFDIVMTTYSTLATEFAHQSVWANGDESEDEEVSMPQSETVEDDVLLVDVNGKPLEGKTAAQKAALLRKTQEGGSKTANGSKKGKRKADLSRESENPLQRIDWFRIVLDEAHTIKEAKTLQSRAVCNLVSPRRIALTGTPVQNRIDDLFSLIKFLRLEPFDDRAIWNQFCGAREKPMGSLRVRKSGGEVKNADPLDAMALARVQTIMKFLTLRRTKEAKMADGSRLISLPPKFSRIMRLDFEVREKALYAEMSQRYIDDIKTMKASDTLKNNYATILHEISNLRMTCDHPGLVDAGKDTKRAKGAVEDDPSIAILQDGLSHDRAVKLFDLLCLSDRARCHICDTDQSGFPRGEEGEPKPVLTRCMHLTCSDCLRKSVGAPTFDKPKADDRFACPECGISISPLLDIQQILPGDVEGNEGGGADQQHGQSFRSLSLQSSKFGCDRDVPLDDRADLSSKIRALLQELEPFSKCNPNSELYDPTAPVLDQVAVDQSVTEGDEPIKETVQVVSIGSGSSVAPIKSVVFSQWTTMLDRIAKALHRGGIKATYLDGRMRRQERSENLEKFRLDDSVEVLLVSLKAGGIGLNLVSACRAYLMEPYWNPATENQGLDRVHRMGQTRPVITTKYVMGDSIEERMLELQKYKLRLAEQVGTRRGVDRSERHHEELNILLGINQ